jgi:hypothetical protein
VSGFGIDLPDLSTALTIDLSSLRTATRQVDSFTRDIQRRLSTSNRGLIRDAGTAGRDSGNRFGSGLSDGVGKSTGRIRSAVTGAFSRTERDARTSGDRAGRGFGSSLVKGVGAAAAVGGGIVAASGIKDLLSASIDEASSVTEAANKVKVVFGPDAASIESWARMADNIGLSDSAALGAAGTFGNLFKALKLDNATSAKYSTNLTNLSADLASFNDSSIDDALAAIQSGLSGETEPLKRFGVNMNAATLSAEALSSGIVKAAVDMDALKAAQLKVRTAQAQVNKVSKDAKATDLDRAKAAGAVTAAELGLSKIIAGKVPELNAAQKAQAAYGLIMEQTALAQGDFARSADSSLANQKRRLDAVSADLKAEIGTIFLPQALKMTKFFADKLVPGIGAVVEKLTPFIKRVQAAKSVLGDKLLVTAKQLGKTFMSDVLPVLVSLGGAISAALPTVLRLGQAFAEKVLPGIVGLAKTIGGTLLTTVRDLAAGFQANILPALLTFAGAVQKVIPTVLALGTAFVATVLPVLGKLVVFVQTQVLPVVLRLAATFVTKVLPVIVSLATFVGGQLLTGLKGFVSNVVSAVLPAVTRLREAFERYKPQLASLAKAVGVVAGILVRVAAVVIRYVLPIVGKLVGFLGAQLVNAVTDVITILGSGVKAVQGFAKWLADASLKVEQWAANIKRFFGEAKTRIGEFFTGIGRGASDAVGGVINFFKELPGRIKDVFIDAPITLVQAGIDTIDGFIRGIIEKAKDLPGIIKDSVTGPVVKGIKDALDINSPSRVLRGIGRNTSGGFSLGIQDGLPGVRSAVDRMQAATVRAPIPVQASGSRRPAPAAGAGSINTKWDVVVHTNDWTEMERQVQRRAALSAAGAGRL